MSEKRFTWKTEKLQHLDDEVIMVVDNANKDWKGHILNVIDMLNELNDERMMYKTTIDKRIVELEEENEQLQKYNEQLKERLEKINGGYGHLTHRNGLTANEWLIESQERELKKKNEEISDWIERHSKDIAKIGEQKSTISQLEEENEQLRGINKEIGDDLYNCRLNKDIVSEKLKLWQDTLAEYDIYTIKDFKELMKNDN